MPNLVIMHTIIISESYSSDVEFRPLFFIFIEKDSNAILDYLLKKTGARSVPRVFVAEKFIGGGSEVKALGDQKKLVPLLQKNGAL